MTTEIEAEARWLDESVGVRELDDRLIVAVTGDDARTWLNGQITNDVKLLSPERAVFGLVLTPKGRILADVTVHEREGELLLDVPREAWPALEAHLEKYVIMEDVTLEAREGLTLLTAQGPRAGDVWPVSETSDRLRSGGRDRIVPRAALGAELEAALAAARGAGGGAVSDAGWELSRVRAGVPRFGRDFGEHVYPQEAGLEKTAISFQKGCYLGQEVVCMLENRGKVSRRLAKLHAGGALAVGDALTSAGGDAIGAISSVAREGERTLALGLIKHAAIGEGAPLSAAGGAVVTIDGPA